MARYPDDLNFRTRYNEIYGTSINKKDKKMSRKNYWQWLGVVALWGFGILFGAAISLFMVISFIRWDTQAYTAVLEFLSESPRTVRGITVAALVIMSIVAGVLHADD